MSTVFVLHDKCVAASINKAREGYKNSPLAALNLIHNNVKKTWP